MKSAFKMNLFLGLLLSLCPFLAVATVTGVSGTTNNTNVPQNRTANVSINWSVSVTTATSQIGTISSSSGTYRAGSATGPIIGSTAKIVSRAVPNVAGTYIIIENLQIPASITYQARQLGFNLVYFQRAFNDQSLSSGPFTGQTIFNITGSSAGGFAIEYISVRFDDNTPNRLLERNTKLGVYAKITYTGVGLLEGVWEIAEPTSTLGNPVYRTLLLVRQQQSGGGQTTLQGPALPTLQRGFHLVRFRITEPGVEFNPPTIRYYVYDRGQKPAGLSHSIPIASPDAETAVGQNTLFRWQKVDGAHALQLEIYLNQEDPQLALLPNLGDQSVKTLRADAQLVSGFLLKGDQIETRMTPVALRHLKPGQWYFWRIIALDPAGNVIALSQPRRFLMPSL